MEGISPELLEILVCPETHQPVRLAAPEVLAQLTALQSQGKLKNRAGAAPSEQIQAALVREDGKFAYPVCDGIPIMLIDEAIPMDQLAAQPQA